MLTGKTAGKIRQVKAGISGRTLNVSDKFKPLKTISQISAAASGGGQRSTAAPTRRDSAGQSPTAGIADMGQIANQPATARDNFTEKPKSSRKAPVPKIFR